MRQLRERAAQDWKIDAAQNLPLMDRLNFLSAG